MAYTTINKSSLNMNTKLYTGTGSSNAITGVGFQPDFTWIKARSIGYDNNLFDVVRGTEKRLRANDAPGQDTVSGSITAFGTDGFTVGSDAGVNANGETFASWNWKAGTGQGSSNTDGSINTTYTSVNTTAGFSISTYTGNGTSGATVGHGLGVVPKMIFVKALTGSNNWAVYHASIGATKYLRLNTTDAEATSTARWNDTAPTSSVFYIGNDGEVNSNTVPYVAYCFAEKTGYSKISSYIGNGAADGTFVYTGFKPTFVFSKDTANGENWFIHDNKRDPSNPTNTYLRPNLTNTEGTAHHYDFYSNGFKNMYAGGSLNSTDRTIIYMAIGQTLVGSNNIPCVAR